MFNNYLDISPELHQALAQNRPIVALESTIISHGLPKPDNLMCARMLENAIREAGALPATIGIHQGRIKIGLNDSELEKFAESAHIKKISRRDLATAIARGEDGATTVAATMACAAMAGIRIFATGGIGGVHRGAENSMDISADLYELSRTPVAVVCAGAKSILDLSKTLEVLETLGVPVVGYDSDDFPAFYVRSTGMAITKADSAAAAARIIGIQQTLQLGGIVIAVPIPEEHALPESEVENWIHTALAEAEAAGIGGKALTPFLLSRINDLSAGRSLQANLALVKNNALVAAEIAKAMTKHP